MDDVQDSLSDLDPVRQAMFLVLEKRLDAVFKRMRDFEGFTDQMMTEYNRIVEQQTALLNSGRKK